jgi:malonate-semialdehyde dehydrogenase (acetylating)/methylmalonate-semialdehyde dehydrogenase
MRLINHWIDGAFVATTPERTGPVFNPATGQQTSEVAMASRADVDLAVDAATRAYETWRDSPLTRRQNIMFAFRDLVSKNRNELASAMTAEHGKTIDESTTLSTLRSLLSSTTGYRISARRMTRTA